MNNNKMIIMYDELKNKHYNKIVKITKFLKDSLGIQYFSYQRVEDDGTFRFLTPHLNFLEYYMHEKLYLADNTLNFPEFYNHGKYYFILKNALEATDEISKILLGIEKNFTLAPRLS